MKTTRILPTAFAISALFLAAGCAQQTTARSTAPAPVSTTNSPELAGAWYQIYFDTNELGIDTRGQAIVKNVSYIVANAGPTRVTVIGKTDRVGTAAANTALSQKRADAVRDALVKAGVPAANIDTSWTGEARQDVVTADANAEARNRVVDVTVVKTVR